MEWISVEDRLPEEKKNVLIIMLYNEEPFIAYKDGVEWVAIMPEMAEIVGDAYYNGSFKDQPKLGLKVTHWQPLPPPPEEDKIKGKGKVKEILDYLNEAKRKITGNEALRGFRDTPAVKAMINARLKEKYAVDDFKLVIDFKCLSWKDDKKMQEYIRPSTLFKASHFPEYLCEAEANLNNPVPAQLLSESVKSETAEEIYKRMAEDARK